ncbi:tetratricopeptide repeat protein [Bremerella cremea]|uniref:tetratricopeptide repeat protein n=1 Tax=Bremerella cremea TaxID=1031537 RepID=UPI0031E73FC5
MPWASSRTPSILFLVLIALIALPAQSWAQNNQRRSTTVPSDAYFVGFGAFFQGDYESAGEAFNSAGKSSAIISSDGRWVDSICYATMLGECHYQMGNNALALENYNTALLLFVQHTNWLLRISPDSIRPVSPETNDRRANVTWGSSGRNTIIGNYPDTLPMYRGNTDAQNQQVVRNGGVLSTLQVTPVRAGEIARCIGLAIFRRAEIMGPLAPHDGLTGQVLGALQRRPAPPNHWTGAWVDAQYGLALAAAGKTDEAVQTLQRSLTTAGQYDHVLTPLALIELGRLALKQQNYPAAKTYFLEATYSAAAFNQYGQIEDALDGLSEISMITEPGQMPQGLLAMQNWNELRKVDALRAKLNLALAEANSYMGNVPAASSALEQARRAMTRRSMAKGRVGIRYNYLSALINFQAGNANKGTSDFITAVKGNRAVSTRLYQTEMTNQLFVSGTLNERATQLLYDELLREPTDADWISAPFETLTVLLTPNAAAMEHWFNTAVIRKQPELALELADRIRRMRFFATLPLGGRMLALRWVLESPDSALDTKAKLQRQELVGKYPDLKVMQDEAKRLQGELSQISLQPDDKESYAKQRDLAEKLKVVSDNYELLLGAIALRRTPSQFLFPPLKSTPEIREKLDDTQLVLSFFSTSRAVHAFLFTKKDYVHWTLDNPREVKGQIGDLLKQIGLVKRDAPVQMKDLNETEWQTTSAELLKKFIPSLKPGFWNNYSELVVIPDDVVWYVPFEAMHTDDGLGAGHTVPLVNLIPVRYAPTASLAVPEKGARPRPQNTAIIVGRLFNGEDDEVTQQHFDKLKDVFVAPDRIDRPTAAPSYLLSKVWNQLVVIDDSEDANRGDIWAWSPAQADRGKAGSELAAWLRSPMGGPEVIYLPGFHTGAEDALKGSSSGEDIFLTSLGLMATGSETVLLSRWHSAGSASIAVVEGVGKRIGEMPASTAMQETIAEVRTMPLDSKLEPRLKGNDGGALQTLDHPYFWADMMLIDTGIDPQKNE